MSNLILVLALWLGYEHLSRRLGSLSLKSPYAGIVLMVGLYAVSCIPFWIFFEPLRVMGSWRSVFPAIAAGFALRIIVDTVPEYLAELYRSARCDCGGDQKGYEFNASFEGDRSMLALHMFVVAALAPAFEEIYYRWLLQGALLQSLEAWIGVAATALLFSAGHVLKDTWRPDPSKCVYFAICSASFSISYLKWGLLGAALTHAVYNLSPYVVILLFERYPKLKVPFVTYPPGAGWLHGRFAPRGDQAEA